MKKKSLIFIALIGIVIGLLFLNKNYQLTNLKIPFFSAPNGHVRVDLINNSDEVIRSITGFSKENDLDNISPNGNRTVTFEQKGEGTY
ncbi:MAG: hypothetical protein JKY54_02355, partial [Flavobacteriales bacterium]|nr:hypothetical protein [Flavobacteriales bacterium]